MTEQTIIRAQIIKDAIIMASEMRAILKDFAELDMEKESAFAQSAKAVFVIFMLLLFIKRFFMTNTPFRVDTKFFDELSISLTGKRGKVK